MFAWIDIFAWLAERKKAQEQQRFNSGFSWAMVAFFIERKSLGEIDAFIAYTPTTPTTPTIFFDHREPDNPQFDKGARRALKILVKDFDDDTTTFC
ncbi:MAG: hypothetical protein KAS32_05550 [Candidatus Peribacteraceae bacterium]|nr:hypothetical protein [Candidatus Peribacteraceae bacterium]